MTDDSRGLGATQDVLVVDGPRVSTRDGRRVRVDSDGRVWVLVDPQPDEPEPGPRRDAVKREG